MREFQSLGGVEGHQAHAVFVAFVVPVEAVKQADTVNHLCKAGRVVSLSGDTFQPADQFAHVLQLAFSVVRVFGAVQQPVVVIDVAYQLVNDRHGIAFPCLVGQGDHPAGEFLQTCHGAFVQRVSKTAFETGSQQAHVLFRGEAGELLQGCGTQLAAWCIDHAQEGAVIIFVCQQAQIGQQILDFAVFEERGAAAQVVGDAVFP